MSDTGAWSYRRGLSPAVVETCDLSGRVVALPPHFHDEDQVTLVLAGQRRFVIGAASVTLAEGDVFVLQAGLAHASLPEIGAVRCRNVYLPAGMATAPDFATALLRWRTSGGCDEAVFSGLVSEARAALHVTTSLSDITVHAGETIRGAAARVRMTREGFSRAFSRQWGLPPRAFGVVTRLNAARSMLRAGEAPAAVAAAVGFADQSHLGREFRRVFGVTPGRYRAGTSPTFQTTEGMAI